MPNADIRHITLSDIPAALGLLSRLPVSVDEAQAKARSAKSVWAYPVAGLVIGFVAALAGAVFLWLGLTPGLTAAMVLAVQITITGAMHEDGLADTADGFWGGWTTERRLEIMKDSRIGTYGVLALGLSLLARWVALDTLIGAGWMWCAVLATATLSRVPMVALMHLLPNARAEGLSRSVGQPKKTAVAIAIAVGLGIALLLTGWKIIPLFIFVSLVAIKVLLVAKVKIGGQTGDVLGATQQLAEITALAVLASIAV